VDSISARDAGGSSPSYESTAANLMGLAETVREIEQVFDDPGSAEPVALTERIDQAISSFSDRFSDVTFDLTHPTDEPCWMDVPGLIAAIEEAVENAVKHNDSTEPVVEIRIQPRSADWIDIEIEDNGPGIPDQELDILRTGETSLNHAGRLGLWFIYWVVSRVGGTFSVTESEPHGSIATLSVPRYSGR